MKEKYYEITWYSQENIILNEEISEELISYIKKAGETLDINFNVKQIKEDQISFTAIAEEHLNLNKALRILQKKMKHFTTILSEKKGPRVISFPNDIARKEGRLKKLIKDIRDIGYYDLHEFFAGDLMNFKLYLEERKLGMIEFNERIFLIDLENLKHKINLNCFECTKKHQYGCCCGSPCDMSRRNKANFDKYEADIAEEVKALNIEEYKLLKQTGGFIFLDGSINVCNGHCALLVCHEGSYKCISHKYALENDLPIYELCPLSCLMYPLEIMILFADKQKRIMLVTSVVEEDFANEYGRWGSYSSLDVELRCINESSHNDVFKKEDYKPVYEVNKGLLIHELGREIFEGIKLICDNMQVGGR